MATRRLTASTRRCSDPFATGQADLSRDVGVVNAALTVVP